VAVSNGIRFCQVTQLSQLFMRQTCSGKAGDDSISCERGRLWTTLPTLP